MSEQTQVWTTTMLEDPSDSEGAILQFPDNMMTQLGWKEGDTLQWTDLKDGSFSISKVDQETEWVLVEAVSTFRMRYMVEVPKGKSEWALDTVSMNEATEFSQEHIGEQIISHRVVTLDEAIAISDIDNNYTKSWDTATKIKNLFTTWEEQEQ